MSGLEKALFNLKFTAKQLNRQAAKAGKDETAEKNKLKKAIQQGHSDIAKIYAQNAIRKQNERLNLLRLGSRIDAVSSRVQTAVTMRQVTGSMANVVKGMDQAMKSMDLEKVSCLSQRRFSSFCAILMGQTANRSLLSWTDLRRNSLIWTLRLAITRLLLLKLQRWGHHRQMWIA